MEKENSNKKPAYTTHDEQLIDSAVPPGNLSAQEQRGTPAPNLPLLDISTSLKAPVLPNVNPDAISYEQAHAGVSVHIPSSPLMQLDDVIVFYWGLHRSVTTLYHDPGKNSVARVLCMTYNFLPHAQYGLLDLYYEVERDDQVIGRSPLLRATVNYSTPVTPRQRQRKRSVSRRYPGK